MGRLVLLVAGLVSAGSLEAQFSRRGPPIQDNSFLVEEAYNQEAGIVQHIMLLQRARFGSGWVLGFTQEWPLPGQRHQVGFTLPIVHTDAHGIGAATGPGDLMVNYRIQAIGGEGARFWLAPRASLVVPSGAWRNGRGEGSPGLQVALPASLQLGRTLAAHLNASLSLLPGARNPAGARASLASLSGGASLVWFPLPKLNFLGELIIEDGAEVTSTGTVSRRGAVFLAPGLRWAHDLNSGMQIVPGVAYARGLGHAKDDSALLIYLSVEHRFKL